jgi:hypothetical protein
LSSDLGLSWDSRYNKHLRNLQYYGPVDQLGMSPFDTSRWHAGMHGGATQDNGNLWTRAGDEGIRSAVRQFEGGDGNTVMFVTNTIALHRNNTLTIQPAAAEIGNRIRRSTIGPPRTTWTTRSASSYPPRATPIACRRQVPCVVRDRAIGATTYGSCGLRRRDRATRLFRPGRPSGVESWRRRTRFERRGKPGNITAVAALDGYRVLAGT